MINTVVAAPCNYCKLSTADFLQHTQVFMKATSLPGGATHVSVHTYSLPGGATHVSVHPLQPSRGRHTYDRTSAKPFRGHWGQYQTYTVHYNVSRMIECIEYISETWDIFFQVPFHGMEYRYFSEQLIYNGLKMSLGHCSFVCRKSILWSNNRAKYHDSCSWTLSSHHYIWFIQVSFVQLLDIVFSLCRKSIYSNL